ncbi:hypothetical protein PoB_003383300 [Plakobranchus ocellatus]|uniref:Uncharacterized protein n=1 Tax=Plakobranchus ocellatus TaxID=259542 RepID=A0AAV4AJA0_9GAST|nr:hypothetical protein PoB_003383300 [Plakobranchus ocellatus]
MYQDITIQDRDDLTPVSRYTLRVLIPRDHHSAAEWVERSINETEIVSLAWTGYGLPPRVPGSKVDSRIVVVEVVAAAAAATTATALAAAAPATAATALEVAEGVAAIAAALAVALAIAAAS